MIQSERDYQTVAMELRLRQLPQKDMQHAKRPACVQHAAATYSFRVEDRARAFAVMNEDPCGDRTHDQSLSSVTRPFVPTSGQPSYFHLFFIVMLLYMLSLTFCLLTCLYVCSVVQLFCSFSLSLSLSCSHELEDVVFCRYEAEDISFPICQAGHSAMLRAPTSNFC